MKRLFNCTIFTTILLLSCLIGVSQNHPSYVPTNGLFGWYPFNGNTNDESGNGNDGINNGAILDKDKDGNLNSSYYFNGTSVIDIPNSAQPGNFTITFWFKSNVGSTSPTGLHYPIELGSDSVPDFPCIGTTVKFFQCGATLIDSSVIFVADGAYGCGNVLQVDRFTQGDIHFVSVSRTDTTYRVVLDSILLVDDSTLNDFYINRIKIGNRSIPNYGFEGVIDNVGIWNRYLSDLEVSNLYNEGLTGLSVSPTNNVYQIKVFPNPSKDNITIDAENYKGVEVYDLSGRLIIKSALKTIDLEEQSKGLYLLKIKANGTTQEFKVFKE